MCSNMFKKKHYLHIRLFSISSWHDLLCLLVPAVPWSLHCHLQQYGEPEALPLGVDLHALHALLPACLHADRCFPQQSEHFIMDVLQPPTTAPPLSPRRCVRLHDLRKGGRCRHSDVISRQRRGHDHFQIAFWNIHHHHLPHYSAPGEVSTAAAAATSA